MFYYPLILKIITFPRITFIVLFRNLTNNTEVSQHSCEQTARGSELEHSYQPCAITRLVKEMIGAKITENNFQLFWTNHLTNTTPVIVKIVI